MEEPFIILLGSRCRVSFDLMTLKLRRMSGVFEWLWTDSFEDLVWILEKLLKEESVAIQQRGDNLYLEGTHIHTRHYKLEEYRVLFERRAARLRAMVSQKERPVLFIRDEEVSDMSQEAFDCFRQVLYDYNPDLLWYFILFSKTHLKQMPRVFVYPYTDNKEEYIECLRRAYPYWNTTTTTTHARGADHDDA